jgi:hypothetical protein
MNISPEDAESGEISLVSNLDKDNLSMTYSSFILKIAFPKVSLRMALLMDGIPFLD